MFCISRITFMKTETSYCTYPMPITFPDIWQVLNRQILSKQKGTKNIAFIFLSKTQCHSYHEPLNKFSYTMSIIWLKNNLGHDLQMKCFIVLGGPCVAFCLCALFSLLVSKVGSQHTHFNKGAEHCSGLPVEVTDGNH